MLGYSVRLRFVLAAAWLASPALLVAQSSQPAPALLFEQEKLIRDRMARLENKMFELSQVLDKSDPKQAARLTDAFRESRQRTIRARMDEIARMLQSGRLSDAGDKQKALSGDLDYLLRMLTEETGDFDARQREIERLEQLRKQLDKIIQEQSREKQRAEQAAKFQAQLQQLRQAAAKAAELVGRQDKAAMRNAGKTNEPRAQGQAAAKEQAEIRADTRTLAGESKAQGEKAKSGESEKGQGAQMPQGEASKSSGKPGESKEPFASPQSGEPSAKEVPAELNRAADRMQKAEPLLDAGKRGEAAPQQEEAAKELRSALQRLQKEADKLEAQMELERQSREQKQTTDKTRKLSEEAGGKSAEKNGPQAQSKGQQQSPGDKPSPQQGGQQQDGKQQQGGQQSGKQQQGEPKGEQPPGDDQQKNDRPKEPQEQQPGQQGMEEAVPHQEQAEKNLNRKDAKKAAEQQEKALEKLQQAQEDLQNTLEQLRREQQEETLTALETRFGAMLARQQEINRATDRLDAAGRAKWSRADQLDLASAAENENWVAESAAQAAKILKDEGTTVVFPDLVTGVHDDAATVAQRLTAADTGAAVRLMQSDIIETLKEMLDSVKKKKAENEKQRDSNDGGQQKNSLLPDSAELKMLRSCQLRVNRSTKLLEEQRPLPQTDMAQLDQDVVRTANRQADVSRLARSLQDARAAEKEDKQ